MLIITVDGESTTLEQLTWEAETGSFRSNPQKDEDGGRTSSLGSPLPTEGGAGWAYHRTLGMQVLDTCALVSVVLEVDRAARGEQRVEQGDEAFVAIRPGT